jgi:hypothetical protein
LSYVNVWAARKLALNVTSDWQKYHLKKMPDQITGPDGVSRLQKNNSHQGAPKTPLPKVQYISF